jgi:putative Holliday junction resolvase
MSKIDPQLIKAPVLALDLGQKRVGVAISDELSIAITRLSALPRTNWKQLLRDVESIIESFDAKTLVIGLPLRLNGSIGDAATEVRRTAEKFAKSLRVPVYLQDERLTSRAAEDNLRDAGPASKNIGVDSESAAIILSDFLGESQDRILISGS